VSIIFADQAAKEHDARSSWTRHPTLQHRAGDGAPVQMEIDDEGSIAMEWSDGARFLISKDATTVHVVRPTGMSHDSICTYLVNSVLAMCLRHRGTTCLHASAVDIDGAAVAFVAPSGSGKSTLAWTLGERGHQIMTDDVAPITADPPRMHPGYPKLRLWPWTVHGLLGDADALPRVSDDWEKRSADANGFDVRDRRLAGIVLLQGFTDDIEIVPVPEPEAFATLMQNVSLDKILDSTWRTQDFVTLGKIAATVPVVSLRRSRDLTTVGESADAVVAWARTQGEG
jgi:hypothetical protein